MTQIGILLALEKSKLTLKEIIKITSTGKTSTLKQASILRKKGQIIRFVQGTCNCKGNMYYYEITDKGRARLKKMAIKKELES